ncbi:MAG: hypothetical protein GEV28_16425 [Actinophytocola sp.]|uniref:hypothetical protein n=1 Tax=Actinophytocola sp. TaxID=1872138 RepID=UPI00132C048E|nr:hypothetical protein [Actinophytocola sp.]MPZ81884.1 hypothetical protein [Actinophytocola sp.]
MLIYRLGVVAVLIILCVGCGTGQRETDSAAVATDFLAAMGDGDTRVACALLATDTRESLEYSGGGPCTSSLGSVDIAGGAVEGVEVWGDRAQARASTGTLFLVELNVGWRVAAAGCTRATDGTYDCLLGA